MDTLDLLNHKLFLAQEFMTWLWFASEQGAPVKLADGEPVEVLLGDSITLGPPQGAEGSRVSVRGKESSLAEAREALRQGKLVEAMRLGLLIDGEETWLTLKAPDLAVSSLKLPAVEQSDGDEGPEGLYLERVFLIERALKTLDGLFTEFLTGRLESAGGGPLWEALKEWAKG